MRRHVQSIEQHGERAKSTRGRLESGDVPRSRSQRKAPCAGTAGAADVCRVHSLMTTSLPTVCWHPYLNAFQFAAKNNTETYL